MRVLAVPPALGTSDLRPDVALPEAVERHLAERREVREVAGRRCQVFRVGSTASDGTLVPIGTTAEEHADVCVDEQGLVLEEWWVKDGEPIRQRVAIAVDADAETDDEDFELAGEGAATRGPLDGSVVETDDVPTLVELPAPDGYVRLGRYDVTAAQVQQPGSGEVPSPVTTVAEVWVRGADFVVLEHGFPAVEPHPYGIDAQTELGPAELIVDLRASELRFTTPDSRTVRLYGTVTPQELLALASTLRAV